MAVTLRKLSTDEVARAFPRRGQTDVSEYVEALARLQPGDAAALDLGGLTARAAKRRLGQAAAQLGQRVRWARATGGDVVYFQVLPAAAPRQARSADESGTGRGRRSRAAASADQEAPPSEPTPPPAEAARPRRGRPRKAAG